MSNNGNEFVEGSSASEIDLAPLMISIGDVLNEWNGNPDYNGIQAKLLPCLAELSVSRLDMSKVSGWKLCGGGRFSEGTYKQFAELKEQMRTAVRKRKESGLQEGVLNTVPAPDETGVSFSKYFDKENLDQNICTYEPTENGSMSAISCTVSFNWDTLRQEFANFQMGEADRETLAELTEAICNGETDVEESDEYQELLSEKQELDRYAGTRLEMSDALRKYLMPEIMLAAARALEQQKDSGITQNDIQNLRLYAERLKKFIRLVDGRNTDFDFSFGDPYGFRDFVYDWLPVIPELKAENILNASNPADPEFRLEFNVVFKLNGLNSPAKSDAKKPLPSVLEKLHSVEQDEKKDRYHKQLYTLMYYLDNEDLPASVQNIGMAMAQYYPSTNYDALARAVSAANLTSGDVWTGYLYFDQISVDTVHNSTLIHVSDSKPEEINIPVSFQIIQRRFKENFVQKKGIGYQKQCSGSYAGIFLVRNSNKPYEEHNRFAGDPFSSMKTRMSISRIIPENKPSERTKSEWIILYDIAIATITTLFLWASVQQEEDPEHRLSKQIRLLLARHYDEPEIKKPKDEPETKKLKDEPETKKSKKNEEESYPKVPGSNKFLTAFGYAAEQAISSDSIITTTQGYVSDYNSYKKGNASNSLLQKSDVVLKGWNPLFSDGVGIVYITAKQCDRNSIDKKQPQGRLSLLMSNGIEIVTVPEPERKIVIRHLPGTNEVCRSEDVYQFRKNMKMGQTLSRMQKDGVKHVILLMDAPYMITTSQSETAVVGLSNDNLQTLDNDFPDLTFLPLYMGTYQIRSRQTPEESKYYALRNLYKNYQNSDGTWNGGKRIPLNAYVLGHPFASGGKDGYRTGTMYEVLRDYYSGRTGDFIDLYLQETNGATIRAKIFTALLLLHCITNEKVSKDSGEGKCSPFARLKQEIAPGSIVTYKRGQRDDRRDPDFTFNYTAYLSVLMDMLEKKGD